ncbi:MAG: nucleoside phosphorylase [Bacillota bacterium]|nr:nucleoside phosphorylase [Bacillota bacterium]
MNHIRKDYPILEYDPEKVAIIQPGRNKRGINFPERCVMTFFGDIVEKYSQGDGVQTRHSTKWETGTVKVYEMRYKGIEVCFVHTYVGAPIAVGIMEFLMAYGVKKIVACGGCGVLDDIEPGHILLPVAAVRDEGTSYHYLPPSREVQLDKDVIESVKQAINESGYLYTECKTWTTDAFYRETPAKVALRRSEGCKCAEMECSALAAAAQFRGVKFAQLLYSGDIILKNDSWDERGWQRNVSAREKLFLLSLDVCLKI